MQRDLHIDLDRRTVLEAASVPILLRPLRMDDHGVLGIQDLVVTTCRALTVFWPSQSLQVPPLLQQSDHSYTFAVAGAPNQSKETRIRTRTLDAVLGRRP